MPCAGYWIAQRLNSDLDRHPPPESTDPARRKGRWSPATLRGILNNPKYTGYMVWNRRATKKGGRTNPREAWIWSEERVRPMHRRIVRRRHRARRSARSVRLVAKVRREPVVRRVCGPFVGGAIQPYGSSRSPPLRSALTNQTEVPRLVADHADPRAIVISFIPSLRKSRDANVFCRCTVSEGVHDVCIGGSRR
jgi:hypothetical protein